VRGTGTAIGSEGISTTAGGVGLRGAGPTGVLAVGGATGVQGTVTTAAGVGVAGLGGDTGVGVRGVGGSYALEASKSAKANLLLQPNNDVGGVASPKTVPTTRTDAHLTGELENVNGELYLCVAAGTPGTWRRSVARRRLARSTQSHPVASTTLALRSRAPAFSASAARAR
jgi:hypothetical protein